MLDEVMIMRLPIKAKSATAAMSNMTSELFETFSYQSLATFETGFFNAMLLAERRGAYAKTRRFVFDMILSTIDSPE
jgi:hypothetical protein